MDKDILRKLEERLGPLYARQRLGVETDQEHKSSATASSPFTQGIGIRSILLFEIPSS